MPNLNTGLTAEQVLEALYRALHDLTDEQIMAFLAEKQNTLAFDNSPTSGSDNPVKSKGIKSYVDTGLSEKQDTLTFDSTPTANSDNPVKSKGIKDYVDNAVSSLIGIDDVYGLGTEIPNTADLNTYTEIGVFSRGSNSNDGIDNKPVGGYAFKLIVEYVNSNSRIRQTFIPLNSSALFYMRLYTSGGWQPWRTFKSADGVLDSGVAITATSDSPVDVHSITTCGRYSFNTSSAANMTNMPYTSSGGELIVEQIQGDTRIRQTLIFNNSNTMVGVFYVSFLYSGNPTSNPVWSGWYRFEGTLVT